MFAFFVFCLWFLLLQAASCECLLLFVFCVLFCSPCVWFTFCIWMPWPPLFAVTFKPLFTYWGRSYFCFYCIRMSFVFLFACSCPFCIAFLLFCILLARFLALFNELPGLLILLGLLFFLYSFSGLCLLSSLLGFIAFACALPFAFASSFWCPFYFPAVLWYSRLLLCLPFPWPAPQIWRGDAQFRIPQRISSQ